MKKGLKKLTLHRETLFSLEDSRLVVGGAFAPVKTVDATACVSNCPICNSQFTNC